MSRVFGAAAGAVGDKIAGNTKHIFDILIRKKSDLQAKFRVRQKSFFPQYEL
jgi:hypothetical protein